MVPSHVRFELLAPEAGIRLRLRAVFGATVPEASVDEHRNLCRAEADIDFSADARDDSAVKPKS